MNKKTIIIIVGVLAVICLCIAGVGLFAINRAGKLIGQSTSTDPVKVSQTASQIADYTLPAGYKEAFAMSILNVTMAGFTREDTGMTIFLFQMPANAGLSSEQMQKQMQQALENQTGKRYNLNYIGSQTATIRGQATELMIYEGTTDQGEAVRQMMGFFEGKNGTAWLMVTGNPDSWDQAGVNAFIQSLR